VGNCGGARELDEVVVRIELMVVGEIGDVEVDELDEVDDIELVELVEAVDAVDIKLVVVDESLLRLITCQISV
jgi:hypothetical protein